MEDALYWTASTIAQVLAGGMGILAAFTLYRFGHARESIKSAAKIVGTAIDDARKNEELTEPEREDVTIRHRALVPSFAEENWRAFEKLLDEFGEKYPKVETRRERFDTRLAAKRAVRGWLWIALWSSAITIVVALGLLPLSHLLTSCAAAAWVSMIVIVAGAVWCVGAFLLLIQKALL